MLRRVTQQRQFARLKYRVAVVHRRDHEMMQIGGEYERYAEHRQEISDQKALLVLSWVNGSNKSKPKLLGNDRASNLQRRNCEPCRQSQHRTDDDLLEEKHQDRPDCAEVDRIGLLM